MPSKIRAAAARLSDAVFNYKVVESLSQREQRFAAKTQPRFDKTAQRRAAK